MKSILIYISLYYYHNTIILSGHFLFFCFFKIHYIMVEYNSWHNTFIRVNLCIVLFYPEKIIIYRETAFVCDTVFLFVAHGAF